ncbi:MAG: molecular chaperone Hsp90 [Sulfuricurvum sp. PC08-66]|nr:MAG: molecular chaperone Hsp90 [Sulfuricurvum sp. PC08-66]
MAKHQFQTEINQLLKLMIHSLYSNKEIFLRELVSNASDALDKLNHVTLTDPAYKEVVFAPRIDITFDKKKKTLTIADSGIGMNQEDLVEHLGTIAKSGTKAFLENLSGDAKKDSKLIGQFGVGFYASFMVAKKVEVISKKAATDEAYMWSSAGEGDYEITPAKRDSHGTTITLYLKKEEEEFLESYKLERIIEKYSNHIPFPIYMEKEHYKAAEKEGDEPTTEVKIEQVNKASALWTLSKNDLKDEDYKDFYKSIAHDSSEPITWMHHKAEGSLEYTTLFYVPSRAPMDLYRVDYTPGVKLYINRVFITDDDKELLPTYLRFLKGVIDSADLPLNVSREILQNNAILEKIKKNSVKKVLSELAKLAKKDAEKYAQFYKEFGRVLKEGLYNDFENREKIIELLQFKTLNHTDAVDIESVTKALEADKKEIYYITGTDEQVLRNSPILEQFKAKNIDVLIMSDEIDTIVFPMVTSYKEYTFVHVNEAKLDSSDEEQKAQEESQKAYESILKELGNVLGDSVKAVKTTSRLKESPACVVEDKDDPSYTMYKMMKQMGQGMGGEAPKPILEINPNHPLIQKLHDSRDQNSIEDIAHLLLDQAFLADGRELANPAAFIARLNRVMTKAL